MGAADGDAGGKGEDGGNGGSSHNLRAPSGLKGGALTGAVQIIHQVGQDVQEERILLRMTLLSLRNKNNAIQVHRLNLVCTGEGDLLGI